MSNEIVEFINSIKSGKKESRTLDSNFFGGIKKGLGDKVVFFKECGTISKLFNRIDLKHDLEDRVDAINLALSN